MAWIKVDNCTPDKPEIFHIADQLEIDPDAVLGKLIRLWIWADSQTYDGNASSVTRSLLDRVAGVTGFALAMENAGWLTPTDGGFVFPNFERHNGQTAKTRALTSKRVQKHRNASSVTSALPEKSRVEKNRKEDPPKSPKGDSSFDALSMLLPFQSDRFRDTWRLFVEHRREIKKKLTPKATEQALKRLGGMGEPLAIATIEHTVSNGWQGLREPDATKNGKPSINWDQEY